jgi:ABC-type dipeptide/oligopeptide/nickel transport system permease subunit
VAAGPPGPEERDGPVRRPAVRPSGRPRRRRRRSRRPFGAELWAGLVLLGCYLGVALSALVVFGGSLDLLSTQASWKPPPPFFRATLGPSWSHPLGVLPGLGTDVFRAVWQATPWDLGLVAAILVFDVLLGWMLGAFAGMNEGGAVDTVVRFVGDTVGSLPSFFWVIVLLAGLAAVRPGSITLPVFVVVFGIVIWPATARTTRERARQVAGERYVESARAGGAEGWYLYTRHILPNSISPLLAQIPIDVAPIFFVLTVFPWFWNCAGPAHSRFVFYLVPSLPPYSPLPSVNFPEWGNLLAVGTCEGLPLSTVGPVYWWMFLPPLVAIFGLALAILLVCDGLLRRGDRRYPAGGTPYRRRRRSRPPPLTPSGVTGPPSMPRRSG